MTAIITIIFGIIALIFAVIAIILFIFRNERMSTIMSSIGTLIFSIISVVSYFNVTIPKPNIFPLDNITLECYGEQSITITSDEGYTIYYSLDGSDPKYGNIYEDSFIITETKTVCARAKYLFWWSGISKSSYTFKDDMEATSTITATPTPEPTVIPTPSNNISYSIILVDEDGYDLSNKKLWILDNYHVITEVYTDSESTFYLSEYVIKNQFSEQNIEYELVLSVDDENDPSLIGRTIAKFRLTESNFTISCKVNY